MKSLGVIETRGLVTAIQSMDAACKAADVTCIGYRKTGAGLVSVFFEGEISAIHTAIECGVAITGDGPNIRSLVIARPERRIVDALNDLKGSALQMEVKENLQVEVRDNSPVKTSENVKVDTMLLLPQGEQSPKSPEAEPKNRGATPKKGKKV